MMDTECVWNMSSSLFVIFYTSLKHLNHHKIHKCLGPGASIWAILLKFHALSIGEIIIEPIASWVRKGGPLTNPNIAMNYFDFLFTTNIMCFFTFSVDIPTANQTLQNIVNRIVQEYLQPEVNNLTPKQD